MNILIVYATNSSGTLGASQIIHDVLVEKGHMATVMPVQDAGPTDLERADFIVLGSCTWERVVEKKKLDGQLPDHCVDFIERVGQKAFPGKPFAVFGLGDSRYTHFCGAVAHLEKFVQQIQGKRVGEGLRVDGFFYDLNNNRALVRDWAEGLAKQLN